MTKRKNKVELFLDSGAFSAWSQGVSIDIYEYIGFIKKHLDVIHVYVNLDVIGNAEATWKNQKIMEKEGLRPLPVYHYGEDEKWLKRYLRQGYEYIGLGGFVEVSSRAQMRWLDRIFSRYLTDDRGYPKVKVHGFGLTSLSLLFRYPWYSVDSTSWVMTSRMGSIYVPRRRAGKWIYDENSWRITVSNRNPNIRETGKHITTLSPKRKELVMDYITEKGYKLGHSEFRLVEANYKPKDNERWAQKKPENKKDKRLLEIIHEPGISNKYQLRDELNIIYFLDLEKSMPEWPWPLNKQKKDIRRFFQ